MKRIFSRWSNFFSILSKLSTGEMLNVVSIFFRGAHKKKRKTRKKPHEKSLLVCRPERWWWRQWMIKKTTTMSTSGGGKNSSVSFRFGLFFSLSLSPLPRLLFLYANVGHRAMPRPVEVAVLQNQQWSRWTRVWVNLSSTQICCCSEFCFCFIISVYAPLNSFACRSTSSRRPSTFSQQKIIHIAEKNVNFAAVKPQRIGKIKNEQEEPDSTEKKIFTTKRKQTSA